MVLAVVMTAFVRVGVVKFLAVLELSVWMSGEGGAGGGGDCGAGGFCGNGIRGGGGGQFKNHLYQ